MAQRRLYEEKLLDDLNGLDPNKWYRIDTRPDYEKMKAGIKVLIDCYYPFIFSNDFTKVMRHSYELIPPVFHKMKKLPDGISVVTIERGFEERVTIKNQNVTLTHMGTSYRVFLGEKLIAIEV